MLGTEFVGGLIKSRLPWDTVYTEHLASSCTATCTASFIFFETRNSYAKDQACIIHQLRSLYVWLEFFIRYCVFHITQYRLVINRACRHSM